MSQRARGGASLLRAILVFLFVLLAGVHAVRTAAVSAYAEEQPARAASLWPGHPDVLRSVAMAGVGAAAGRGQAPPEAALDRLERLAAAEPLAAEPLLVHGALAQRGGDLGRAEQLVAQARRRDPRSAAARFLLAELYLRSGRIVPGLAELSVLGRLIPGAREQVVPALAAYASSAGALPHLKRILLVYPELEPVLLNHLAQEPRNADLIVALAAPFARGEEPPRWQGILLEKLIASGDFERAHSIWSKLAGVPREASRGLLDPGFAADRAPPPFGWTFTSNAGGLAEPKDGGLDVLYFGRDDTVLASQMMLLPPGRYRLQMRVEGLAPGGAELSWRITCLPGEQRLLDLPLASGSVAGSFTVAGGCAAQRLELRGVGEEFPQSADFHISGLQLVGGAG